MHRVTNMPGRAGQVTQPMYYINNQPVLPFYQMGRDGQLLLMTHPATHQPQAAHYQGLNTPAHAQSHGHQQRTTQHYHHLQSHQHQRQQPAHEQYLSPPESYQLQKYHLQVHQIQQVQQLELQQLRQQQHYQQQQLARSISSSTGSSSAIHKNHMPSQKRHSLPTSTSRTPPAASTQAPWYSSPAAASYAAQVPRRAPIASQTTQKRALSVRELSSQFGNMIVRPAAPPPAATAAAALPSLLLAMGPTASDQPPRPPSYEEEFRAFRSSSSRAQQHLETSTWIPSPAGEEPVPQQVQAARVSSPPELLVPQHATVPQALLSTAASQLPSPTARHRPLSRPDLRIPTAPTRPLPKIVYSCQLGLQVAPHQLKPLPKQQLIARRVEIHRQKSALKLAQLMKEQMSSEWSWLHERSWEHRDGFHDKLESDKRTLRMLNTKPSTGELSFEQSKNRGYLSLPAAHYWTFGEPLSEGEEDAEGESVGGDDRQGRDDKEATCSTLSPVPSEYSLVSLVDKELEENWTASQDMCVPIMPSPDKGGYSAAANSSTIVPSPGSSKAIPSPAVGQHTTPLKRKRPELLPLLPLVVKAGCPEDSTPNLQKRRRPESLSLLDSITAKDMGKARVAEGPPPVKRKRPELLPLGPEPPTPTSPPSTTANGQTPTESPPVRRQRPVRLPSSSESAVVKRHPSQPVYPSPLARRIELDEPSKRARPPLLDLSPAVPAPGPPTPEELPWVENTSRKRPRPDLILRLTSESVATISPAPQGQSLSLDRASEAPLKRARPAILPMRPPVMPSSPRPVPYPTPAPDSDMPCSKRERPPLLSMDFRPNVPLARVAEIQQKSQQSVACKASSPIYQSSAEVVKRRRSATRPTTTLHF